MKCSYDIHHRLLIQLYCYIYIYNPYIEWFYLILLIKLTNSFARRVYTNQKGHNYEDFSKRII